MNAADIVFGIAMDILRLCAKYLNKVCSPNADTRNNTSNKTISPALFGLDFRSLKLLTNK